MTEDVGGEYRHKIGPSFSETSTENHCIKLLQGKVMFIFITGSRKNFCFVILSFAFDELLCREGHVVIVVSPLKLLMKTR